jgi:hypothetical protein
MKSLIAARNCGSGWSGGQRPQPGNSAECAAFHLRMSSAGRKAGMSETSQFVRKWHGFAYWQITECGRLKAMSLDMLNIG